MRKLILVSLLALAFTAPVYAGEMGQPIAPPSEPSEATVQGDIPQPIAVSGDIPNGIAQTVLTLFGVALSVV